MQRPELETLFARYADSGDPEALAAVFDRTAPDVLRVALHLAGNPADAEDLLQATFTSAMTGASGYDRARPLLPWLLGILAHEAGTWRRKQRRAVPPERLVEKAALDPAHVAEHRELVEVLTEKVTHLPQHYRSVLVLYLRHGLAPAEIAEALHRAPATVRSQLARGLELLRKALPVGLAGLLATAVTPARGLAAVRRAVLVGAKPAAFALPGGLALLALAVALVLGLGALAWHGGFAPVPLVEAQCASEPRAARSTTRSSSRQAGRWRASSVAGDRGSNVTARGTRARPRSAPRGSR